MGSGPSELAGSVKAWLEMSEARSVGAATIVNEDIKYQVCIGTGTERQ